MYDAVMEYLPFAVSFPKLKGTHIIMEGQGVRSEKSWGLRGLERVPELRSLAGFGMY